MARPRAKFDIVAEDKTAKAFKSVGNRMDAMTRAAKATGAIVAAAVTGLGLLVTKSLNAADAQAKLAQSTGFTIQELGRLAHAAELSGTSFDRVAKSGLNRFSRSIFDANEGLKASADVFAAMNIAIKNTDGTLKTSGDLLSQVADKFATYEDGVAKSALAQKLFGRAGTEMIPMLNAGSAGLAQMGDEAERLGLVFDGKTAAAAERFNDNLTRLQGAFTGQVNSITQHLLPSLETLSNRMVATSKDSVKLARTGEAVAAGFNIIVTTVDIVVAVFGILGRAAGAVAALVVEAFADVGDSLGAMAAAANRAIRGDFSGAMKIMDDRSAKAAKSQARSMAIIEASMEDMEGVAFDAITGIADTWTDAGNEIEAATPEISDKIAAPLIEAEVKIKAAAKTLPDVVKDVAVDPMIVTAKNGMERLGDVFAQGWRDVLDGNLDFGDTMKNWFKGLLSELLHTATTNRIIVGISGTLGLGGSGSASAGSAGGFGGGGAGGGGFNLSGITNLFSDPIGGLMGATSYAQQFALDRGWTGAANFFQGRSATLANTSSLAAGAAGFLGNFGGNALLGSDRGVGANIGGAIGGTIGSIWGPIGTGVGAFLGNAVGGLFGSSEPSPPKFWVGGTPNRPQAATDSDGWARTVEGFGDLGGLQFSGAHLGDNNAFLQYQPLIDEVIKLDNLIADLLTPEGANQAAQGAQGFKFYSRGSVDINAVLRQRAKGIGGNLASADPTDQAVKRVLTGGGGLDEVAKSLTFISAYNELVAGNAGQADKAAEALEQVNEIFNAMEKQATALGLSLEPIADARNREIAALREQLALPTDNGPIGQLLKVLTGTTGSTLPFADVLTNAQLGFSSAVASGDVGDIAAAGQNLISVSDQGFATGQGGAAVREGVIDALRALLADNAGEASASSAELADLVAQLVHEMQGLRTDNADLNDQMARILAA